MSTSDGSYSHRGVRLPRTGTRVRALRLLDRAEQHWPQLTRGQVTYRGAFGYFTGVLRNGERIPLCPLRYGGSAHSSGFAIYSAASDRCQDAVLRTGLPAGTRKKPSTPPAPSTLTDPVTGQAHNPAPPQSVGDAARYIFSETVIVDGSFTSG